MQPSLTISGCTVAAGSRETIHLPLPYFYTHSPTTMPVHVVRGRQPGPSLLITSALHGDELNGIETIRRLLMNRSLNRIRGTLICIPVVNVFGFVGQSRYLPDRRDLNRSFPGSPKGSMAARLANLMVTEILPSSTHLIDLHTGAIGRDNFPQIRGCFNMGGILAEMARAFNAPVLLDLGLRPGTFRETAHKLGIPSLVYEAGEALRFDEVSIRAGVSGILNVMAHLGMIRKRASQKGHHPIIAKSTQWIRASQSGVTRSLVNLGEKISTGQPLAYISDPFGEHEEVLASPVSGIVIGRIRHPLVHEGEAVFHIAKFDQPSEAAESIGIFQDAFDPLTGTSDSEEPPLV
jgi:predicted deacylase